MAVTGCAAELHRVPLFARVDPGLLTALEPSAFVRRLARGQILFVSGEPSDHVFVVRHGRLKVRVTSERGTELVLAVVGPGDTLGDVSMIDRGPRSADVLATEASELLAVPTVAVDRLLREHPEALWAVAESLGESLGDISVIDHGSRSADVLATEASELLAVPTAAVNALLDAHPAALRAVAESLAAGMRRLTQQAADLVFLDLPRRLVKLLLEAGRHEDGGTVVAVATSQSELAAMLGVTRQSLNRSLSALARRGWLQVAGDGIRLVDLPALTRFVHS